MIAGSIGERPYKSSILHVLVIVLAGIAVYSNTLHVPFQLDDKFLIAENPIIKDIDYIIHPSAASGLKDYGLFIRRFVGFATFALNYSIHGLEYPGYHIFNISLHIINSLLLYCFMVLTFRTPLLSGTAIGHYSRTLAFVSALVFVAHPVHTEAVTYILQRITALSFMFYILSLCLYALARMSADRKKGIVFYVLALLSAVLAVKTKENSFTLPLAVALYEMVFFKGSMKRRAAIIIPFVLPLFLYVSSLHDTGLSVSTLMFGQKSGPSEIVARASFDKDYLDPSARRSDYMLTEQRVIVTYLRLLLFPLEQNFLYNYPTYSSFLDPPVFLSAMFHIMLLALGAWCIVLSRRKPWAAPLGVTGFGIWFFYIALLMESSLIPIPLLIAEYRVYLPSVGLLMAMVCGAALGYEKIKHERKASIALAATVVVVITLCAATYLRNGVWGTKISLWSDVVTKSPDSSRANYDLGTAYCEAGDYANAVRFLEKALQLKQRAGSRLEKVYNNLSVSYIELGMYDEAIGLLEEASGRAPQAVALHYNLARAYKRKGMWQEAVSTYGRALEADPEHYDSVMGQAGAYKLLREPTRAMALYERALAIRPGDYAASSGIATMLLSSGQPDKALPYISAVLKARPRDAYSLNLLEVYYAQKKSSQ